jgi:hypothetical protein
MVYLYAHTNFKSGLDSLRRVKVIYDRLKSEGVEAEILLNEYRAQLLARDWGLPLATTIETIKDIDAVATDGDTVLIDSDEEIEGKVLNYPERFKVIYLNSTLKDIDFSGAEVINIFKDGVVVPRFKNSLSKEGDIFIYGDSDYEKRVLKSLDDFKGLNLDIYWGIYFFVKYEDILKESFKNIVESEEYYQIFSNYSGVVTSSIQVAFEAKYNSLLTLFLNINDTPQESLELLKKSGIGVANSVKELDFKSVNSLNSVEIKNLDSKISHIILSYM